ncbi:MAG TPA: hypothetical protein VFH88_05650 [Candidatus Krumholzibacteria bacterium]|nr:hypothetical protein [Candidatus Krumholzibacteria bacterium]
MTMRRLALLMGALLYLHATPAPAEPILKPHKYSGPIPQSLFALRVGAFGGATNDEMIQFLDGRVKPPFEVNTKDFGTGLTIEGCYMHKPHPRFGVRVNGAVSFVKSTSTGNMVPQVPGVPDTIPLPEINFNREFKVELITLELSGVYYFADAALNEFQPYLGAGFSVGLPHETFKESRVETDTGQPYTDEIPGVPTNASEWDFAGGVHAVGGVLYYFADRWALSTEARVQLMQDHFGQLKVYDPETGDFENANFVVDYTGFYISAGVSYGF